MTPKVQHTIPVEVPLDLPRETLFDPDYWKGIEGWRPGLRVRVEGFDTTLILGADEVREVRSINQLVARAATRGRNSYRQQDLPLAHELQRRKNISGQIFEEALALAEKAVGGGDITNKARRLMRLRRELYGNN